MSHVEIRRRRIKDVKQRLKTKIPAQELVYEIANQYGCTLRKAREYIKVAQNG